MAFQSVATAKFDVKELELKKLARRYENYKELDRICKGDFDKIAKFANPLTHEIYFNEIGDKKNEN